MKIDKRKVYDLIAEKELTAAMMAENAGCTKQNVSLHLAKMREKKDLKLNAIIKIAKMIGVKPSEIML